MKVSHSNILNIYVGKRLEMVFLVLLMICFHPLVMCQDRVEHTYRIKTVVIDAGHGGKDPGTLGQHCKEKDIALAIALKLGKYIEENVKNVRVIYTRKTDVFLELHQRGDIANKNHADLFISIHCNASPNKTVHGAETYVMGLNKENKNMEIARKENSVITLESDYTRHYEGFDPNSPESYILFNLMQNTYLDQSLEFASLVQKQFRNRAGRNDRGVWQAGFLVLWKTSMPSVLIETGYLSNPSEEKYLMSDKGQSIIASAIYRAFKNYKQKIEKHSVFSMELTDSTEIYFSVQVMASRKKIPLDQRKFTKYKPVTEYKDHDKYKYAIGRSASYDEIKKLKQNLMTDFPDAFIIAIQGNKIISLKEALKKNKRLTIK